MDENYVFDLYKRGFSIKYISDCAFHYKKLYFRDMFLNDKGSECLKFSKDEITRMVESCILNRL